MSLVFLLLVIANVRLIASFTCETDLDCSLGGECVNSKCKCDVTWTGLDCGMLNLQPAKNYRAFYREKQSSWGGSVLYDPVTREYHMFAADMAYNCTLDEWTTNSRVVHAVSKTPEGPYDERDVTVPIWAHNPTAHFVAAAKVYVVYHIGNGKQHGTPIKCAGENNKVSSTIISSEASSPNFPNMAVASSTTSNGLNVQFHQVDSDGGDWAYNNPAVYFFPNGSALLISKVGCTQFPNKFCPEFVVAVAPSYKGPFKIVKRIGVYGEDPYVWRDKRGNFHILFQGGNYDPSLPIYVGHWHTAFSQDGFNWQVANLTTAFNQTIALEDGSTVKVYRRERCQVLFDENGMPSHLFNGATFSSKSSFSFTSVQPILT